MTTRNIICSIGILCLLCATAMAQPYRCDWSVNGIGGGDMSSAAYRCGSTCGQTANGTITSASYQGFIGFWQIDTAASGVREDEHWTVESPLVTRLFDPAPNPAHGNALVRYSLATEAHVSLRLFDLAGRNVRSLVNTRQKPGNYQLRISGFETGASRLGRGVYFLKMSAGDYQATRKLIVQ